ncbi:hypothetical protein OKW38_000404 [Paraburkholderia sp. MM5496-R1]
MGDFSPAYPVCTTAVHRAGLAQSSHLVDVCAPRALMPGDCFAQLRREPAPARFLFWRETGE